jgi:UDP:flavonoid glycosyltransferase YjiC (YdhE family)
MSITEAAYRGVPVVGIPFMFDQHANVQKLLSKVLGVKLDYRTLTKESILSAVREVLHNDR